MTRTIIKRARTIEPSERETEPANKIRYHKNNKNRSNRIIRKERKRK